MAIRNMGTYNYGPGKILIFHVGGVIKMANFIEAMAVLGTFGGLLFLVIVLLVTAGEVRVRFARPTMLSAGTIDDSLVKLKDGEVVMIDDYLLEELGALYASSGIGGVRYNFYNYLNQVADIRKKKPAWKAGYNL
jgi:hypothetical protein